MQQMLISTLVGSAAVAVILSGLALVAIRLNRPAAAHVLWLLVIVKLLTPPIVPVAVTSEAAAVEPVVIPVIATPAAVRPASVGVATSEIAALPATVVRLDAPVPSTPICVSCVLGWIWIAGSIAWVGLVVVRIARFRRLLKHSSPADDALRAEVDTVADRIGLPRTPEVRVVDAAVSPLLWFVGGRVSLVLPKSLVDAMSPSHREGVIAHELAHLRRRDHWVRLLEIVATAVLWWHPLLWLARRGLHEAEEQCCDAWVVAMRSDAEGRRTYADALIDALELVSSPHGVLPAVATGLGRVKHLQRRVTMILTSVPRKSLSGLGKLAVAAVVFAAIPIVPVRGQAQPADPTIGLPIAPRSSAPSTQNSSADEETHRAVTALIEAAAQDTDQTVKNASSAAIAQFGPRAVPALVDALAKPSLAATAQAQLSQLGPESLEPLIDAIASPDARVRTEALNAISQVLGGRLGMVPGAMAGPGGFGVAGAPLGPPGAAMMMEGSVPGAPGVDLPAVMIRLTTAVTKASRDTDVVVRRSAVRVLGLLAPQAAMAGQLGTVMPSVLAAMKDADAEVRSGAAWVVTTIGPAATGAIDALTAAAKDEDVTVRYSAMHALKTMGPAAKAATPAVIAALKDRQPTVRAAAAEALGAIQSTPPGPLGAPVDPAGAPTPQ